MLNGLKWDFFSINASLLPFSQGVWQKRVLGADLLPPIFAGSDGPFSKDKLEIQ